MRTTARRSCAISTARRKSVASAPAGEAPEAMKPPEPPTKVPGISLSWNTLLYRHNACSDPRAVHRSSGRKIRAAGIKRTMGCILRYNRFVIALALALGTTNAFAAAPDVQDSSRTPGVADPAVTQSNIRNNICTSGYTASLRPDTRTTNAIKRKQLEEWGYTDRNMKHYEEDHLISLQLGGAAEDEGNLWPEHYAGKWGARIKDTLEGEPRRRVCRKAS